jgi:hypothetical protein
VITSQASGPPGSVRWTPDGAGLPGLHEPCQPQVMLRGERAAGRLQRDQDER